MRCRRHDSRAAYNESATIEASVTRILTLEYRNYEVVVVKRRFEATRWSSFCPRPFDLYEIPRVYPRRSRRKADAAALYRSRSAQASSCLDKGKRRKAGLPECGDQRIALSAGNRGRLPIRSSSLAPCSPTRARSLLGREIAASAARCASPNTVP